MTMLQHGLVPSTGGYQIERSLRFNSADTAYLNRTFGSAGNRKTWTWSSWVKRSALGGDTAIFTGYGNGTQSGGIYFSNDTTTDALEVRFGPFSGGWQGFLVTTQVFRDPSAWYHIVFAADTTQATDTNRLKLYINGVQVTAFGSSAYPAQNADGFINQAQAHEIGRLVTNNGYLYDGYITECYFIDGSALTPSSFGETDTDTGVWKPKAYSGTYGTNGFYLKFADNSGTTSTTLGKDSSGNGNNWTPNNFSVTAGTGNDSFVDSPTSYGTDTGAGGEVRGNYCTLNPLKQTGASLTNGNLQFTKSGGAGASLYTIHPTLLVSSGKWYFEVTPTAINTNGSLVGIVGSDVALATYSSLSSMTGNIWAYRADAYKVNNGSSASYGNTWTTNDVIGVAVDMDNGKIWWSKNGTWQASGDPAAGTNAAYTNVSGSVGPLLIDQGISGTFDGSINAGQRPFAYTAPSGFKALCTQNLPTPDIGATATTRAGKYFNTVLYTGSSASNQSITGVGFQPDFVWIKSRSNTTNHALFDAVRGADKWLLSNATNAESSIGLFPSFDSNGFTVSNVNNNYDATNYNNYTYASWNWKANGAGSSNTQGTISSTVSANTTAGFSIVRWDGNGAGAAATIGHGLGVAPKMIINKGINGTLAWSVYHASAGNTVRLTLNSTDAVDTSSGWWNNTTPTSTVFTVGSTINQAAPYNYVAYCFAEVAGYSAFGSYTGNGSTDGPFIYTGFRPKWILIKPSSLADVWQIEDAARSQFNVVNDQLFPNSSAAEQVDSATRNTDFLSNGFKIRGTNGGINQSSATYVYACFAENPFKYSLAR